MLKSLFSFHSKVARRIFLLFVVCALLPVCLLALVSLQRVSDSLREESRERLRQIGKNAGMTILEGLTLLQAELESMAVVNGDETGRIPLAAPRADRNKRFRAVYVMKNVSGNPLIPVMRRSLSAAELAHLSAGNALILADKGVAAGDPILMATAVNRNLKRDTLLVGEIEPGYLWTLVGYTLPPAIEICILGASGKSLFATLNLPPPLVSHVLKYQRGGAVGHFEYQGGGTEYLVNYWSVFMKPAFLADTWTVVAVQSKRDSLGPVRSFRNTFILVVLLALFVVIFASSVLIRRNLVPLSVLREGARRISGGDFDSRVELATNDEFQDVAAAFNDMSTQLGKQFTRLSEMGRLVQRILEADSRDTIVDDLMSSFRNTVPCEWLGISLADGNNIFKFTTVYNNGSMAGTVKFETLLSSDELKTIRASSDCLHVNGVQGFASLLSPIAAEGGDEFFLFPISNKDTLAGILVLGYRLAPEQIREELVTTRQIADEVAIALDNVRLIDELNSLNLGTIEVLANAVDAKSPWTAGHSERVTRLALEIGKEMGISKGELDLLHWGGLFHDMGKIGVPEYILDKPGKLTEEEYDLIKKHPGKGAEILGPIRAYNGAIPIVAQHHERFDGQGYPLGLAGEEIYVGARILAVADVFDALYSDRPYRQGWEIGKVISYLKENAGRNFDPEVVKAFMRIDQNVYIESHVDADPVDQRIIDAAVALPKEQGLEQFNA